MAPTSTGMLKPPPDTGLNPVIDTYNDTAGAVMSAINQTFIDYSLNFTGAIAPWGEEGFENETSTPRQRRPEVYSLLYRTVAMTLSSIVFTVGLVGNILVVVVIARTKSMHTPTNCYLLSLAVADCLVLLSATLPAIPETFFRVDEWPFGEALCPILVYAQYVGIDASSMSIGAFTVERYIAICHPIKAQTMCTLSRAKKIIAAIWIFTVLYCSPWLGLTYVAPIPLTDGTSMDSCRYRLEREWYVRLYTIDLIVFYIIPLVVSSILYCLIGRILYVTSLRNTRDHPARAVDCLSTEKRRSHDKKSSKRRSDSRVQVIRMLVVVVLVFATLWMPYRVMVVYNSFAQKKFMDLWFLMFSRTLIYINCAINPILYNVMSVKFRRAFKNHLCCVRRVMIKTPGNDRCVYRGQKGLHPAAPPPFHYSDMATEARQTFTRRPSASPPKKEMSPFINRAHLISSHRQLHRGRGQDRQGHPFKVILLELVKGSDKVKVQASSQMSNGLRRNRGRRGGKDSENRVKERTQPQGEVRLEVPAMHTDCVQENGTTGLETLM